RQDLLLALAAMQDKNDVEALRHFRELAPDDGGDVEGGGEDLKSQFNELLNWLGDSQALEADPHASQLHARFRPPQGRFDDLIAAAVRQCLAEQYEDCRRSLKAAESLVARLGGDASDRLGAVQRIADLADPASSADNLAKALSQDEAAMPDFQL